MYTTTDIGSALGLLEIMERLVRPDVKPNLPARMAADIGEMAVSDAKSETTPDVRAQQCRPSSTCARGAPPDPRSSWIDNTVPRVGTRQRTLRRARSNNVVVSRERSGNE